MASRYETIKQIIESLPESDRRICVSEGACACKGCVTSKGISKNDFAIYLQNYTTMKPLKTSIGMIYLFDERGYPTGTE